MSLPLHRQMPEDIWTNFIEIEKLKDGKPVILTGNDIHLPGPDGYWWELTAVTGSIRLTVAPNFENDS